MRVVLAAALVVLAVGACKTRLLDERAVVDGGVARDLAPGPVDLGGFAFDLTPIGCGPEVDDGKPCAPMGSLCATGDRCCVCGGLVGFCSQVWICARPARNDPRCPAAMPPSIGACTRPDGGLTCRYCAADGVPWGVGCTQASIWLECANSGAPSCWFEAPLGANCD